MSLRPPFYYFFLSCPTWLKTFLDDHGRTAWACDLSQLSSIFLLSLYLDSITGFCTIIISSYNHYRSITTKMQLDSEDSDDIPEEYLRTLIRYYLGEYGNVSIDFSKPHLNPYFATSYPFFVVVYSLLIILSLLANIAMICHVRTRGTLQKSTRKFLINIGIASTIHVVFVLPITLAVMLMQNWIFGKFICYSLPMIQDIPIHTSMLTYLIIAGDRYRFLSDPRKPPISALIFSLTTWFFAICLVLPYSVYATYFDSQNFSEAENSKLPIRGLQMCIVNLAVDIQEYMRSLFVGTYIAPLSITTYFYIKCGQELKNRETLFAMPLNEGRIEHSTMYSGEDNDTSNDIELNIEGNSTRGTTAMSNSPSLDFNLEKQTQKYLILMTTAFATCLCPLMILRLIKPAIAETYENAAHITLAYVTFVWVAFLPAFTTPCLYAFWQTSIQTKDRLRGYLHFSNRRHIRVSQQQSRRSIENLQHHCCSKADSTNGEAPQSRADSGVSGSVHANDESITFRLHKTLNSLSRLNSVETTVVDISSDTNNVLP